MKFRRPASALLAAAMLFSSSSVTGIVAYADEDEAMKTQLTYVKQRIDIPEKLSEFSYRRRESNGRTTYSFTWQTDPEQTQEWGSIGVSICDKVITSYYRDDERSNYWGEYSFGKLTKEQILKKADEQLKKLNPTIYKNIELKADALRVNLASTSANVSLTRVKDGIPVAGQNGSISIDKDTGELMSYNLNWVFGAGFGDSRKAVSVEKAQEGFKKEFPISLVYAGYYDWQTKDYVTNLIYKRDKFGQIDAFTGKLATFEDSYGYYDDDDDDDADIATEDSVASAAPALENGVSFTDKEIEKMELEDSLIKPADKLKELMDSKIFNVAAGSEVTYSNNYYNDRVGAYVCNFSFKTEDKKYYSIDGGYPVPVTPYEDDDVVDFDDDSDDPPYELKVYSGSCTFNAETGEVYSYWASSPDDEKELKSEKSAKKTLESSLKKIAGDKSAEFKIDAPDYHYIEINPNTSGDKDAPKKKILCGASVSSPRYAYDIPSRLESMNISVNGAGRVCRYDISYYGIEYPAPENIISSDEAYSAYFGQVDYSLLYRCAMHEKRVETALVYNESRELYINAFTGKLADWNGNEIQETVSQSGYTDLEGSKYRAIAEKLALYGITLMDDKGRLDENTPVTRDDFRKLIRYLGIYSYGIGGEEKDLALDRKYAAKMLTANTLNEAVADIKGIFKSPFSDVKEDNKYVGYITVANALGLMSGKDGKFSPNKLITRGEALKMIYDFLA